MDVANTHQVSMNHSFFYFRSIIKCKPTSLFLVIVRLLAKLKIFFCQFFAGVGKFIQPWCNQCEKNVLSEPASKANTIFESRKYN